MKDVVIVDGVRTPIGSFGGGLKAIPAHQLAHQVIRALLQRTRLDPVMVDEVILGNVGNYSDATNVARVAALLAGVPIKVPAYSVHRNCSSGLQAIVSAYQHIVCGDAEVVIAGGVESMSQAPYVSRDLRWGKRLRHAELVDSVMEELTDGFCGLGMGQTAENLAEEFKISRQEQDAFALMSHQRAVQAWQQGIFKDEVIPVDLPKTGRTQPPPLAQDESPRADVTLDRLAQLPPVFKEGGTVTAGNSSPLNDGAAATLVVSAERAKTLGLRPLGTIRAYAFTGVEPERMGIGPAAAIPLAVKKAGLTLRQVQLIEVNEAFAAQYLAVEKAIGLDRTIVNVNGGAIALGHPTGMSGARLAFTLLREMARRDLSVGVVSLCIGGGQGAAAVFERA